VPFPPDRGDRIRAHHLLKALARLAPVHVGCFGEGGKDAEWLRGPLAGEAKGIATGSLAQTGFFDPKAISGLAEAHIAGRADHSRTLWQLLMLEKSLGQLGVSA